MAVTILISHAEVDDGRLRLSRHMTPEERSAWTPPPAVCGICDRVDTGTHEFKTHILCPPGWGYCLNSLACDSPECSRRAEEWRTAEAARHAALMRLQTLDEIQWFIANTPLPVLLRPDGTPASTTPTLPYGTAHLL